LPDEEAVPYFIRNWIPLTDDVSKQPIYCASILMLLRPWGMINDIMEGFLDFKDTLDVFISGASPHIIATKDGIDSYHRCCSKGKYVRRILDSG
jgi:hypothetical protein